MEPSRRRCADGAVRQPMFSPGRPPVGRREHRQRFWEEVARGLSSEESAVAAGVSPAVGTRWFRECGGMPPFSLRPPSGRYLSFVEREEIAVLQARGHGVREIARQLGRAASTISRELRRNAATRGGNLEYRATTAHWHADRRAKRPKVAKFAANGELRQYVQDRLGGLIAAAGGPLLPPSQLHWRHGPVVRVLPVRRRGLPGMAALDRAGNRRAHAGVHRGDLLHRVDFRGEIPGLPRVPGGHARSHPLPAVRPAGPGQSAHRYAVGRRVARGILRST